MTRKMGDFPCGSYSNEVIPATDSVMANSISALEASKAVNALSHYCADDQEAPLQVIEDYFDSDSRSNECDSGE